MTSTEKKFSKKEEVYGGLFAASLIISLILIIIIIWSPAGHYLSKWSDYWGNKDVAINQEPPADWANFSKAVDGCREELKGKETNSLKYTYIEASSTNGEDYKTYDCWAVKYEKVK